MTASFSAVRPVVWGSTGPRAGPDPELLMRAFRHGLLKALLAREIITEQTVELLLSWRHPVKSKNTKTRVWIHLPFEPLAKSLPPWK